jgi:hypothetical protein
MILIIDNYFEHHAVIDEHILNSFWEECEAYLENLGVPQDMQKILLQDIRDYAAIESSIRQGKELSSYDLRSFYFKKSCDMRLQRHIVRYLNKQPPMSSEEEITRDILEEIEDDLDDIEEDRAMPFNGNRYVEVLDSKDETKLSEYFTFVQSQKDAPKDLVQRVSEKLVNLNP